MNFTAKDEPIRPQPQACNVPSAAPVAPAAAAPAQNKNDLAAMLAQATPEQQRQMLGERLYMLIIPTQPRLAGKITGMLLEGWDTAELLGLIDSPLALDEKIKLAVEALQKYSKACHTAPPAEPQAATGEIMKITVTMITKKKWTLEVKSGDTVYSVKTALYDNAGIPQGKSRLIFARKELQDGRTLADCKIGNGADIMLLLKLDESPSSRSEPQLKRVTPATAPVQPIRRITLDEGSSIYEGRWNVATWIAEGHGTRTYLSQRGGVIWRDGKAVIPNAAKAGVYVGGWQGHSFHGNGVLYKAFNDAGECVHVMDGEWKDNHPEGFFKITYSGDFSWRRKGLVRLEGVWMHQTGRGSGIFEGTGWWNDGSKYVGEWNGNMYSECPHGRGVMFLSGWADGLKQEGEWDNGVFQSGRLSVCMPGEQSAGDAVPCAASQVAQGVADAKFEA